MFLNCCLSSCCFINGHTSFKATQDEDDDHEKSNEKSAKCHTSIFVSFVCISVSPQCREQNRIVWQTNACVKNECSRRYVYVLLRLFGDFFLILKNVPQRLTNIYKINSDSTQPHVPLYSCVGNIDSSRMKQPQ